MRIVITAGIYPPDIGGPATYSELIAREFTKGGHDVKVICYSDKEQRTPDHSAGQAMSNEQFSVIRISRKHNKLVRYWLYFWELMKIARDADVIYGQGPLGAGLPAMWVAKILKKKFVIKIVGDYAWEQGVNQFGVKDLIGLFQKKKYNQKVERIRKIQKEVVKKADKVIVPSEFLKRIVLGWAVDENKIEVIYNAFSGVENVKPKKLEGDVIISAGRLERWKGMDMLIELMPELLEKNPDFRLIIIGRGPEWENLKSLASDPRVEEKTQLIDRLPHSELMGYFKASKMFVLNTTYEGLSHIILEAMAMGLSVVTTNVGGNPEIIKNGHNGLLVEYNDKEQLRKAILKLWRNKGLQRKFIKNGREALERFGLEEMIDKTLDVLKTI